MADKYNAGRQKIDSIQALRALAFLGILTSHTGIRCFCGAGKWGSSVFLILSGFMMTYRYYGTKRIISVSVGQNLLFAGNKIKKLYLLHVITTFIMFVFGSSVRSIRGKVFRLFLNLLLIQEWMPIYGRSLNGVSWYLCVMVFLYFIFPWVLKYMEKDYCAAKAWKIIIILFGVQVMTGWMFDFITMLGYELDLDWVVYKFPPVRALDFVIGCHIGYLFLNQDCEKSRLKYTIYELTVVSLIIASNLYYIETTMENSALEYSNKWWTFSVIFTVSSGLVVYLFAKSKGLITKIFTNQVMLCLGNISQYAFLIHYVVFRSIDTVCVVLYGKEFVTGYGGWVKITIGFVITIFISLMWKHGNNILYSIIEHT